MRARVPARQAGTCECVHAAGSRFVTIESQTPVADFDVFAFSVSFEWDYTNIVTMLRLAGLEPRADRSASAETRWWSSAAP